MRRLLFIAAAFALFFGYVYAQGFLYDPRSPFGTPLGISYGVDYPANPSDGHVHIDVNPGNDPGFEQWSGVGAAWRTFLTSAAIAGTGDTIPRWDATGTNLIDSQITDDGTDMDITTVGQYEVTAGTDITIMASTGNVEVLGQTGASLESSAAAGVYAVDEIYLDAGTDVIATGGLLTVGAAPDAADSVELNGTSSLQNITFEGSVADDFEVFLGVDDPTSDVWVRFPDYRSFGASTVFPLVSRAAGTSIPHASGAVWVEASNVLAFEGTTANAWEVEIFAPNPLSAEIDLQIPNNSQGWTQGAFLISTMVSNEPNIAESVWAQADVIFIEGNTADAFEAVITATDFATSDVGLIFNSPAAGVDGAHLELNVAAAPLMAPGDIVDGFLIDFTMDNDTGGTFNFMRFDPVTNDAQSTYNAINVETGYDSVIYTTQVPAYASPTFHFAGVSGTSYWMRSDGIVRWSLADDTDTFVWTRGSGATPQMILDVQIPAGASGSLLDLGVSTTAPAANGGDIRDGYLYDVNQQNNTGGDASNTHNAFRVDNVTPDADTLGYGVYVETGWMALKHDGVDHATLTAAPFSSAGNGTLAFCTNCDPLSTPCTTGGASTGAFAFRVAGAWDCPM